MKKTLDLLVVEDDTSSTDAARASLESFQDTAVDYASDYVSATNFLSCKKYDGVFLDIFFPEKTGSSSKEKAKILLSEFENDETLHYLRKEIEDNDEKAQPLGLLLAKQLKQQKTEFVFVSTIGFGHGMKTNPFYSIRKYVNDIGARDAFDWSTTDLTDPRYRTVGVNELIAQDTAETFVQRGENQETLRTALNLLFENHPVYAGMVIKHQFFETKDLIYWGIKLGLVSPVKGKHTYEGAFRALRLPFRPLKKKRE